MTQRRGAGDFGFQRRGLVADDGGHGFDGGGAGEGRRAPVTIS